MPRNGTPENGKTSPTLSVNGNRMGRPPKLICDDETCKQIEGLARIQCTMKEAGAVLGVHQDTFSDFLHANEKAMQAWEFGQETGKASLRRNQAKMAETNPTMAIWLGKQMLGQKDNMVLGGDAQNPLRVVTEVFDFLNGTGRELASGSEAEASDDDGPPRMAS